MYGSLYEELIYGKVNVDVKVVVTKSFGKAKVNLARGWVIASIIVVLITLYEIHL